MVEQNLSLIDKLQERGLIDRWGFIAFATVGSFGILGAKWYELDTWIVATGAISFMLLYAVIVNMRGTGKLRSDQAGDNCYYLGLIYTLTSLAFAIFTFDPEKTATTIVQGFGIALATTIAGLVLRVFFSQSRVDLFEVEDTARLELAAAAAKLKTELAQISVEFKQFSIGLQQSVQEVRDEAAASVKNAAETSISAVKELAFEVAGTLRKQADELAAHSSELAKKTSSVSRSIDRHSASIDGMTEAHNLIVSDVKGLAKVTRDMSAHSQQLLSQAQTTRDLQQGTQNVIAHIDRSIKGVLSGVQSSLGTIQKFEAEFAARLSELEGAPKQMTDKALGSISDAAEAVQNAMVNLTQVQEQAIHSVSSSTDGLLAVVRGHNTALEAELTKSRQSVEKVHTALVDMTAKLADVVE